MPSSETLLRPPRPNSTSLHWSTPVPVAVFFRSSRHPAACVFFCWCVPLNVQQLVCSFSRARLSTCAPLLNPRSPPQRALPSSTCAPLLKGAPLNVRPSSSALPSSRAPLSTCAPPQVRPSQRAPLSTCAPLNVRPSQRAPLSTCAPLNVRPSQRAPLSTCAVFFRQYVQLFVCSSANAFLSTSSHLCARLPLLGFLQAQVRGRGRPGGLGKCRLGHENRSACPHLYPCAQDLR
ncbi:uncharacterized protein LOC129058508 [Pongo abelii]|uniref:uncharacterized protein LOC129058508 n=1 Tax=Pongo abelii TaxID=9601 RepID=UPI003006775B